MSQSTFPGRSLPVFLLLAVWLLAAVVGLAVLTAYEARPGSTGQLFSGPIGDAAGHFSLVLVLHPHCPCSRASLTGLREILARAPEGTTAEVLFVEPEGAPVGWEQTALWSAATAIPGVRVRCDTDGAEAGRLGVETSGHLLLYDAAGELLFSGGITRSRGHEGDNPGRRAVRALLNGQVPELRTTPVYGCPLRTPCTLCETEREPCQEATR
jgi:hypothetical protein